jgi:RNA polymerase sigma factor (sigma-70 family)
MSENQPEFRDLMRRVREGSEDAARQLLKSYGPHIIRAIRRALDRELRSKFDSTDFEQAVWASFFANPADQYTFERPEALIAFLVRMAQNKVADVARQRLQGQKYNVNREHSLEGSAVCNEGDLTSPDPSPSQVVAAQEEWDHLLEAQPERDRRILELLRQRKTHLEIARELDVSEKTVRRVIVRIAAGEIT